MLLAAGIILATAAAVFGVYGVMRVLLDRDPEDRTRDLAASVLFRISALHGLVLALVFASEVVEYQALAFESAYEANAVSDLYYDALRYGDAAGEVGPVVREYLRLVVTEEWASLASDGRLSGAAWSAWDRIYEVVLDLAGTDPREIALRDNMLAKVHLIAENRDLREHHAATDLSPLFWIAAVVGVLMVAMGYYAFPPKRDNLVLLSVFSAYTGLILFTIYAMSNPFSAPAALEPSLFSTLLTEIDS